MTKLKKRWIPFVEDFTRFVPILTLLLQVFGDSLASTTARTPIQKPPSQNYKGQGSWQRRSSQQYPPYQQRKNDGNSNRNQDIPWEQEQLLPMPGYQGHNQGQSPQSFMKFYPDALEKRLSSDHNNQGVQPPSVNSNLDVDAIRKEMNNKDLSLRETQHNPDSKSQTQQGDNSIRNQTAWNSDRPNQGRRGPATAPPYWYDGPYRGRPRPPYRGRGDPRPYPDQQYARQRFRPPTYPPPTYPPPKRQGGPDRREQNRGTQPRGWDRGGPYDNRQGESYYRQGSYPRPRPGGRGALPSSVGSGVGSGHHMMVDPDLPDPLDDHWQRMQSHKAWEIMNGGSGNGLPLPPMVPPRRWGDRGEIPGGPTTPPWPNMDKRRRQNTGRAKIWAEEGSGFAGSGRSQVWMDQGQLRPNRTSSSNVTVNTINSTGNNTPTMKEFQGGSQGGQPLPTRGTIPPPPPTHLLHESPFQRQSQQQSRDQWDYRMQQLAAWERQQPIPYPPYERPDSLHEARREQEEERSKGRTTWTNQVQPPNNGGSLLGKSEMRFPDQGSGRPSLKLSDLSPSLATILGNMTQQPIQPGQFPPNAIDSPAMTHTFPPQQQNPMMRNRFTDLHGGAIPRQGEQLQTPNIPMRPYTDTRGQRTFIGEGNQTKGDNQTDPDGPVGGDVWQTPQGQQQLSHGESMLGPLLTRAKARGFDVDHEQESELESEDSQLRKIIVGMYMEKLAIKDGEGRPGYDPFQAAMADVNSTLWSTLRNISHNRDSLKGDQAFTGNLDNTPTKSAAARIPTDIQRIRGRYPTTMTTQDQRQLQDGFQRRQPSQNPKLSEVIPHMDTVLQRPTGMPTVTGRGLNPMIVRGSNSGNLMKGQPPSTWPQSNQGQGRPSPRPAYNPHNPRNVFVPQGVYPQTFNPQIYDPRQAYDVRGQDKVTETPSTTTIPPQDNNDQNQNNDQNELEEILPVGTKILPSHIPKILAILNVSVPITTPRVLVASQIDGVKPGNNNEPARMINIPGPTEEIQTATEFLQQDISTARTIVTESTSSAFGIIVGCLVACAVVVGPGVCIGCRMRQRSKQRERKKAAAAAARNEESGIMEAIIMSELGRSALNRDDPPTKGARSKSRSELGTFQELQNLRSGRESPTIIVH
ncbi:uncharacterized protein LOC132557441 [Ylistrum balloti]|uniref:uncharacterized protein LOC132557441 n=1 Tax=Ylistrum balloti TaxID=509963 RepID=UPI002905DBE0|nr:uncharacterized protein LOC132557441 [Ylistrum balloti]